MRLFSNFQSVHARGGWSLYSDPLAEALRRYDVLTNAETKILDGQQAYSIGGRSLTRADLGKIRDEIDRLDKRIAVLRARGAGRNSHSRGGASSMSAPSMNLQEVPRLHRSLRARRDPRGDQTSRGDCKLPDLPHKPQGKDEAVLVSNMAVATISTSSMIIQTSVSAASVEDPPAAGLFFHFVDEVSYVRTSLFKGEVIVTSVSAASVEDPPPNAAQAVPEYE